MCTYLSLFRPKYLNRTEALEDKQIPCNILSGPCAKKDQLSWQTITFIEMKNIAFINTKKTAKITLPSFV